MIQAGLRKESSNQWNNPIVMLVTPRQAFSLLNPSMFDTFYISFSIFLATPYIPLPIEYDNAFRRKQYVVVEEWEKKVACLTSQEDDLMKTLVQRKFKVFLKSYSLQTSGIHLAGLITSEIPDNIIVNNSEVMAGNPNNDDLIVNVTVEDMFDSE